MEARFIPFDDLDELFATIDRGVKRANDLTLPRQKRIQYGDYWMRLWQDIMIFGYIETVEELDAEERRLGASEEEIEYEHEAMESSYARGFRFGRAYSIITPEGELGDTHISTMVPLTKEEFEQARSVNWLADEVVRLPWFSHAVQRLTED